MGLEHSKLRHSGSSSAAEREGHSTTSNEQPNQQTNHQNGVTENSASTNNPPDDGFRAEEPAASKSLHEHRELVQKLRAQSGSNATSAADKVREEMQQAGIHDQRIDPVDETQTLAVDREPVTSDNESTVSSPTESESETESSSELDISVPSKREYADDDEDLGTTGEAPKTKNELDDDFPVPSISHVNQDDLHRLERIGTIHSVVDNVVLIEQTWEAESELKPREYDVLDSESLLCFENGQVLGLVYETFGSVQKPMYTVRFRSAEDIDSTTIQIGRAVYFLPSSSTFVLARSICTKGSDASNMWDEEVAEDEVEYSDDEEELSAKRQAKKAKTGRIQQQPAISSTYHDLDPATASLGPLGNQYVSSGAPVAPGGRRRRSSRARNDINTHVWSGARTPFPHGDYSNERGGVSIPHINPRFADQWIRQGSTPPMPYPPMPVPPVFPMSVTYSPHHPSMVQDVHNFIHEAYNPHAPGTGYESPHGQ